MTAAIATTDRLHGLDALRGFALLLGVVLHASLSYLPTPIWFTPDSQTSPMASALFFVIHLFRMTVFFLIAGLFAHMLLHRRGWAGFVRDRLIRIAGPLFGLWWVVFPAIVAVIIWSAWVQNGGAFPQDAPPPPPLTLQTFPLTHLWFLWMLLVLYAGMLLIRLPFAVLDREGAWGRGVDRVMGVLLAGPLAPVVLAAPLALALYLTPGWVVFGGAPTPDTGFVPNPAALTGFGAAFAFGFLLDRRRDLLTRIAGQWLPYTVIALGTGAGAMMLAGGPAPSVTPIEEGSMKAFAACVYAVAQFTSAFAVTALALKFLSGAGAIRRFVADSSYWIYIIHLPVVMAGQVLMLNAPLPWWGKMAVIVAGTTVVGLITYKLLVRHTFLGKALNGRRVPWRRPAAPAAVPAE